MEERDEALRAADLLVDAMGETFARSSFEYGKGDTTLPPKVEKLMGDYIDARQKTLAAK